MTLRELRLATGLRPETVAAKVGISRSTLDRWELGRGRPDIAQAMALATLLGCSLEDIATGCRSAD